MTGRRRCGGPPDRESRVSAIDLVSITLTCPDPEIDDTIPDHDDWTDPRLQRQRVVEVEWARSSVSCGFNGPSRQSTIFSDRSPTRGTGRCRCSRRKGSLTGGSHDRGDLSMLVEDAGCPEQRLSGVGLTFELRVASRPTSSPRPSDIQIQLRAQVLVWSAPPHARLVKRAPTRRRPGSTQPEDVPTCRGGGSRKLF